MSKREELPMTGSLGHQAKVREWQPWERNFSGGRVGVQEQQGSNENWTILHVESGGRTTTTSLRHHEAWDLALMLSPALKSRLEELFRNWRAAADANHALTYRATDTELLRSIADERDCGNDCERQGGWAHCPMIDRGECGFADAESLRNLATGIDLANATLEADVLRVVDSCGGVPDAKRPEWSDGYDTALAAVETELRRFFARNESAVAEAMRPDARGAQADKPMGEMAWQPIATAPKGHLARFLAYARPRSDSEQTIYEVTSYDDKWGSGLRLNDGYGSIGERDILNRITHWMPLPPPPITASQEKCNV